MEQRSLKGKELTAAKLRWVLRWSRNKKFALKIKYAYNNSVGGEILREYYGRIKNFTVINYEERYKIKIQFENGGELEEWLINWHEYMEKFNLNKQYYIIKRADHIAGIQCSNW